MCLENKNRRNFIKKTTYATPTIILLGSLTTPITANSSHISRKEYKQYKKNYKQARRYFRANKKDMNKEEKKEYRVKFKDFRSIKKEYINQKKKK